VELLTVIMVIAIIASIGVPAIAGIAGSAGDSRDLRNAQSIATTYNAAINSGMSTNAASNEYEATAIMMTGTNFTVGGNTYHFSVGGLSEAEATNASSFLTFQDGTVQYAP